MLIPVIALAASIVCLIVVIHSARKTWRASQEIKRLTEGQ